MARPSTALRARLGRTAAGDAELLLQRELPALPTARRGAAAAFVGGRVAGLPSPMAVGVGLVAATLAVLGAIIGQHSVVAALARRPLPLAGDYVRLLRSLAFAYVWETWPDSAFDGSATDESGSAA